ncbi:serine threonine kinase [Fusarium pseudocircinatum]|uniref:Serine threonine kinase n=1 Tax=Fusarium pseudocircinatum TaxID=56676 RepID=A0A8H5KQH7_9HYPO|nr:serine threonine kinase [Fusarium pseudocircinatum]
MEKTSATPSEPPRFPQSLANPNYKLCENCKYLQFTEKNFIEISENGISEIENYNFTDSAPDFPLLNRSANNGCVFCSLLRDTLCSPEVEFDMHEFKRIRSVYHANPGTRLDFQRAQFCLLPYGEDGNEFWLLFEIWIIHPSFTPTRLVDVRGENVKLVEGPMISNSSSSTPKYAALSYCWGPPSAAQRQLKTDEGNYHQHLIKIPISQMPLLLQDAIRTARELHIPFLWVDSLCIIQGNEKDWEEEANKMHQVYGNAYITICPVISKSCERGFLHRTPPSLSLPYLARSGKPNGTYSIRYQRSWIWKMYLDTSSDPFSEDLISGSWVRRGWTFQEAALSSRTILFGSTATHFQCKRSRITDGGREGPVDIKDLGLFPLLPANLTEDGFHSAWRTIISSYTQREFTNHEDRIAALAGLAHRFHSFQSDNEYCCGMWRSRLPEYLLWRHGMYEGLAWGWCIYLLASKLPKQVREFAPSWSWIHHGNVDYSYIDDAIGHEDSDSARLRDETLQLKWIQSNGMEDIFISWKGQQLEVRGFTAQFPFDIVDSPSDVETDEVNTELFWTWTISNEYFCHANWDNLHLGYWDDYINREDFRNVAMLLLSSGRPKNEEDSDIEESDDDEEITSSARSAETMGNPEDRESDSVDPLIRDPRRRIAFGLFLYPTMENTTLTTNAEDVVSGFEEWFKHKPNVKDKSTDCDCLCSAGLERYEQGINKPKTSVNQGEVPDLDKLYHKTNGNVSNGTNNDTKPNGKPDVQAKVEPKVQGESNPKSNSTNEHKKYLEWHNKRCFGTYQFGKHKDIYPISQQNYAGFACPETESKMIKKGNNSTFISYQRWIYGAPYLYNVYWKDFCELKDGKTEQDVTDPLEEGYEPGARVCQETLTKAYRGCDNEGTGGSLQAGCLVYEFQARDKDQKPSFSPWMRGKGIPVFEEERLPFYKRQNYYPMRIGQVIKETYQVIAKLGYGTSSTVWLSRDLSLNLDHAGRQHVREVRDTFKLSGPYGEHEVFVMSPLGMGLRTLQELQKDSVFQQALVTSALDQTLLGLNYLHDADVIHTGNFKPHLSKSPADSADIHSDNLLVALTDDSILSTVEDNELHRPSARKFVDDIVIHVSQYILGGAGALTICDLGQARIGKVHRGKAMPLPYRAPEVILGMTWGNYVDVWSVGLLAWDLLHKNGIFRVYDKSEELNDAHHLAAITALLGPPPDVFLKRSDKTGKYWDTEGKWHGPIPLPSEGGLRSLDANLSGGDRDQFLNFLAGVLTWLPEDRLNSAEAYFHPWLRGEGGVEQ